MGRLIHRVKATRIDLAGGRRVLREEALAAEEPLEIRLGHESFSVTMRTPGDDFDLVAGFLVPRCCHATAVCETACDHLQRLRDLRHGLH